MKNDFTPKLFTLWRQGISRKQLAADVVSGIVVGIVALPLAIAFAIASGVSPEKGLITAIVAGFIISAFGGSRVQIGGPTGAFIVIVYGIVAQYGLEGLILSTFMAGFILMAFGFFRLGNYLKFIPYPLIVGFTSGIALIILTSQINDFLGLGVRDLPADFLEKWPVFAENIGAVNPYALAIGVATVIITLNFRRITSRVPGSLVAIVLSAVAVQVFQLPVETIGSRFGDIPARIALPALPALNLDTVQQLIQPAFTIALLGAIESLLSAVVADGMTGGRHRPNIELVAQGGANIFSALFGGIPATGAIARTATNVRNGGRTPVAGIVHAFTLLGIMLVFAPYTKAIPLSCLAGILVVVAYHMSEWRQFTAILKSRNLDVLVLLSTFLLTVVFDLVIAIEVGIVLSSFLFMKRMSESLEVAHLKPDAAGDDAEDVLFQQELEFNEKEVVLYEVNGPLFFGAAQQFHDALASIHTKPRFLILRMRYVPFIDSTGYERLKSLLDTFRVEGVSVLLSGVSESLRRDFEKNGLFEHITAERVFDHINAALDYARGSSGPSGAGDNRS